MCVLTFNTAVSDDCQEDSGEDYDDCIVLNVHNNTHMHSYEQFLQLNPLGIGLCFGLFSLGCFEFVSTSAVSCLEQLVSDMT